MKKYFLIFFGLMFILKCDYNYLEDSKIYQLRDRGPAGGWIFYINPNWKADGWKYLEAAPADQDGGSGVRWGVSGTNVNGTNSSVPPELTGIGDGKTNTNWIKNNLNRTSLTTNYLAFYYCITYTCGGYSDWFLPSRDELKTMCWNLKGIKFGPIQNPDVPAGGVGGLSDNMYWSSSEFSTGDARYYNFDDGSEGFNNKDIPTYRVRAVRAF
jgi:hypothetical protein